MPNLKEDNQEQEVKAVKAKGPIKGTLYYLVQQKGQPPEYNQQVPKADIANTTKAI